MMDLFIESIMINVTFYTHKDTLERQNTAGKSCTLISEQRERAHVITYVWWERVPQLGSQASRHSAPQAQSEVEGGKGSEGAG